MASRTPITSLPSIPVGEAVARFESYEAARQAVDRLVRAEFPPAEVAIVGSELKSVERVTGRMTAARAAASGLMSGVMLGMFVGLLLLIISPSSSLVTLVSVVLLGIGFSVLWGMVGYALNRRRKEFTSVMQVVASSFVILVPPAQAGRARQILGTAAQAHPHPEPSPFPQQAQTPPPAQPSEPVQAAQPAQPARKRTYAEAQAELRQERERRAVEQRLSDAAGETPQDQGQDGPAGPAAP